MTEADNLPAWTGRPGAYEVWFLTMNDARAATGYWIRSTLLAPVSGPVTGGVWFARFDRSDPSRTFGVHQVTRDVSVRDAFDVRVGDASMSSGAACGSLAGGGHRVSWDLRFGTGEETFRVLPPPLYRGSIAPTRPYAPNVDTRVGGVIEVDGDSRELEDVRAQQGHLVGTRHAERWAWAHCGDFVDEDAVVHALTATTRRGPLATPYTTFVGVRWREEWLRLSKVSRRPYFGLGTWRLDVRSRRFRLSGRVEAPARAMLRARYEDPDGTQRFCHNTEVASSRLVLFERRARGFEEVAVLESNGTTHAEWAGRAPARAVERAFVDIGA